MNKARKAVLPLLAALAAGVFPGAARAEVKYWVTNFDVSAAAVGTFVLDMSDTGYVSGNFSRSDGTSGGFLYHNGTFTVLPGSVLNETGIGDSGETLISDPTGAVLLYAGGTVTNLTALGITPSMVNGPGLVVGTRNGHPVIFQNGAVTELTAIDGTGDFISANGYVAGMHGTSWPYTGTYLYANGVVTNLPFYELPGYGDRRRRSVNTSGIVVGFFYDGLGQSRLGFWDGTQVVDLGSSMPNLPQDAAVGYLDPRMINARGDISGNQWFNLGVIGVEASFIYSAADRAYHDLGGLGGLLTCVHGVNDKGEVSGHSALPGFGTEGPGPNFVFTGGKIYDLNTLVPAGTHYLTSWRGLINNKGQILTDYSDAVGAHAFLLTPLPVTVATVSGSQRADGWYTTNANVRLAATDAVTGVKEIHYALDGGAMKVIAGASATQPVNSNGAHTVSFFAVDNAGHAEEAKNVVVNVDKGGFVVTNTSPVVATAGTALTLTLTADRGTAPYTWSVAGALPPGLSRSGALISGTPTTPGTYPFTVTARDQTGKTAASYLTIVVLPPLVVTTPSVVNVSQPGMAGLHASGGTAPLTWTLSPETPLPAGLFFYGATIATDGTLPLGEYGPGTFTVTDDAGRTATKTIAFGIYPPIYVSGPTGTVTAVVGAPIEVFFSATGGRDGGYKWSFAADAPPPAGLSIDAATGTVSGSVATAGIWTVGVVATDTGNGSSPYYFVLQVL